MTLTSQKQESKNKQSLPVQSLNTYQLRSMTMKSTTLNASSSMDQTLNNTLTGLKKTCGLFNTETNIQDTGTKETEIINSNEFSTFDECVNEKIFDDLFFQNVNGCMDNLLVSPALTSTNSSDELNFEKPVDINQIINNNDTKETFHVKSEFMKRVENQNNMKIESLKTFNRQDSFNIILDDEIKNLMTPSITNACHDFFKSVPPQLVTLNTSDIQMCLATPQPNNSSKYVTERNPFLASLSSEVKKQNLTYEEVLLLNDANVTEIEIQKQISVESVTLDHDYVASPKKRKHSFDDDESNTQDTFDQSKSSTATTSTKASKTQTASANQTQPKRKRVKGIYRAGDVTNNEELQNYLERRRKNNISSKQSRLSKKTLYTNMEDKSNQLEKDNEQLKQQIIHLENLTKLLKDVLLQRFTTNIK